MTEDEERGLMLLRGRPLVDLARDMGAAPRWSAAGRGWVVPATYSSDLLALAQFMHLPVNYKSTRGAA